ncbi:hypothetical protein FDJ32_gp20 [Pseudomonas phage NV1]|uniref:Uncharacterized protein n=1 Tax=Pseudomonas phage NV1 TaxID=2079543 RepID=A0A2L0HPL5_9CAUD|nr:hypothetical protein FDJ32_gp20 [Pseudomonas phage NV1]AUX83649.1 hypothetical protein NV1_p20 [Pseudomonas phage NV1]
MSLVQTESVVISLDNTVATRGYPFTQETLDQIRDIRYQKEKELGEGTDKKFLVPAPVVIAEAIDKLHAEYFP